MGPISAVLTLALLSTSGSKSVPLDSKKLNIKSSTCSFFQDKKLKIIDDISTPICLNIDPNCQLYVCDFKHHRIVKYDAELRPVGWIGESRDGTLKQSWTSDGLSKESTKIGGFYQPHSVEFDDKGHFYVNEYSNNRLQKFGPGGEVKGAFGLETNGEFKSGFTMSPTLDTEHKTGIMKGVATAFLGPDSIFYFADYQGNGLIKVSINGEFLAWLGKPSVDATEGTAWIGPELGGKSLDTGFFSRPHAVTVDADGIIYVADTWNHRLVKLNHDGQLVGWMGEKEDGTLSKGWEKLGSAKASRRVGAFNAPTSINFDKNGDLIIAEYANHRVQKVSREGKSLGWIGCDTGLKNSLEWRMDGESEQGIGQGCLVNPYDARMVNDWLFIADTHNNRIQVVHLPSP